MHHDERQSGGEFHAEVPVGDAVEGVVAGAVEAEGLRGHLAVNIIGRAGQRAGTEGRYIHPFAGIFQSGDVPQEHFGIGEQVVPEDDRLCPLQVGVARHDVVSVFCGKFCQNADKFF